MSVKYYAVTAVNSGLSYAEKLFEFYNKVDEFSKSTPNYSYPFKNTVKFMNNEPSLCGFIWYSTHTRQGCLIGIVAIVTAVLMF